MDSAHEVLLLDDDPAMLVFLEGILTGAGYACSTETDPEAALSSVASRQEIGLVLSDVYMPGLTGLQFIDRLHALPLGRPAPRVLLLTAQPSLESAIDALRLGAQDFLLKPIRPPELIDAIGRALSRAQSDHTAEQVRSPALSHLVRQADELASRLRALAYASDGPEPPATLPPATLPAATLPATVQRRAAAGVVSGGAETAAVRRTQALEPQSAALLSVLDTVEQLRHLRTRYGQHELDELQWDLLLEVLRAERLHQRLSISALTISVAGASSSTALRRVNQLVSRGYLVRLADPADARRDFVSLTAQANELLTDYLSRANAHMRGLLD